MIVSAEVVQDRNDEKQFSRQHTRIEDTLGKSETREYIVDGGYKSLEQLEYIADNKIDGYVGNSSEPRTKGEIIKNNKRITKKDFRYNQRKDVYVCPAGKELKLKQKENNEFFKGKRYQTKQCAECELIKLCLAVHNKKGYREIRRDDREIYAEMINQKMKTNKAKERLIIRRTTVEPVIGNIKWNMRGNRFRLKGLMNVNGEFYLMCIGHNINKLYKLPVFIFFINIFSQKYKYVFSRSL